MSKLILKSVKTDSTFHKRIDERINEVVQKEFTFEITMQFSSCGDFAFLETVTKEKRDMFINELLFRHNMDVGI